MHSRGGCLVAPAGSEMSAPDAPGSAPLRARAGNPKGVVLTHANVLATITALQTYVREVRILAGARPKTLECPLALSGR